MNLLLFINAVSRNLITVSNTVGGSRSTFPSSHFAFVSLSFMSACSAPSFNVPTSTINHCGQLILYFPVKCSSIPIHLHDIHSSTWGIYIFTTHNTILNSFSHSLSLSLLYVFCNHFYMKKFDFAIFHYFLFCFYQLPLLTYF